MPKKIGVLLINIGTPKSASVQDVASYLTEFLSDPCVIDYSWLLRTLLVRGLIVPLRKKRIAKAYESIWTEDGSPLLLHLNNTKKGLQSVLGESFHVASAMRYQEPSIEQGLKELIKNEVSKIIAIPLFPQYAKATTGSIIEKTVQVSHSLKGCPPISFIQNFYSHPLFYKAFEEIASEHTLSDYDKIMISFHGLPERQVKKDDHTKQCLISKKCCEKASHSCYRAQCLETAKLLRDALKLPEERCTVCFQSRLGQEKWLKPYTIDVIKSLAQNGAKKLLVFSPSFVADCLETLYEINVELQHEFKRCGGEKIDLVSSLNSSSTWIDLLRNLVLGHAYA